MCAAQRVLLVLLWPLLATFSYAARSRKRIDLDSTGEDLCSSAGMCQEYKGRRFRTLDGTLSTDTTSGCHGKGNYLPVPVGWTIANDSDSKKVAGMYPWGTKVIIHSFKAGGDYTDTSLYSGACSNCRATESGGQYAVSGCDMRILIVEEPTPDLHTEIHFTLEPEAQLGKWYEASAGAAVPGNATNLSDAPLGLGPGNGCTPRCAWRCESPQCNEICVPRCGPPRCRMRCPRPDITGCNITCGQPHCRTECPPMENACTKQDCPKCETKCQEGPCKMECHKDLNCSTECEQPQCQWKCRAPEICPKPVCKMVCEAPRDSCPNCSFHERFPQQLGDGSVVVWEGFPSTNSTTSGPRGKPHKGDVFNPHVGQSTFPGALVDKDGNIIGDVGDLVRDGAFRGQVIIVLHLYNQEAFDFVAPTAALEEKGFNVTRFTENTLPSPANLDGILKTANQCWLISSNKAVLSAGHIDVMDQHWRSGMGMYVLGDNDPYYVDANNLLTKMNLPTMSGNVRGQQVVHKRDPSNSEGPGFLQHALTTGISSLYEGDSVATFADASIKMSGMIDVLREHQFSKIVAAFRGAQGDLGPVVVDGAFTKMYSENWDTTGSARFVKNIAAMLAVQ